MTAEALAAPAPAAFDLGAEAARATAAILHDTLHGTERGVVVDSPPGAGKSTLVVRAALELAEAGRPDGGGADQRPGRRPACCASAEENPDPPGGPAARQ